MNRKARLKDRMRNWGNSAAFAVTRQLRDQMTSPPEPDQEVDVEVFQHNGRQHVHYSWIIPETKPAT